MTWDCKPCGTGHPDRFNFCPKTGALRPGILGYSVKLEDGVWWLVQDRPGDEECPAGSAHVMQLPEDLAQWAAATIVERRPVIH